MSKEKLLVLIGLFAVLLLDAVLLGLGAYLGHNGLFSFGAETGKVAFGTVLGALASAFSGKT